MDATTRTNSFASSCASTLNAPTPSSTRPVTPTQSSSRSATPTPSSTKAATQKPTPAGIACDLSGAAVVPTPAAAIDGSLVGAIEAPDDQNTPADSNAEENDPSMPHNWPSTRKWLIVIALNLISLMVNMSLVICAPASAAIARDLNNTNSFLSIFYITVPNLGQVISPLYIGPMSEKFGRVPVCHFFNLLFLIFTLITGFSDSLAMIVVFRFLGGSCIASICLNPAITGDLFSIKNRGSAMSITMMIPILGSAIGPIAGGYITQYLSWRWTFWMMAILTAFFSSFLAVVLKETYTPVLRRKATKSTSLNEKKAKTPSKYFTGWNMTSLKAIALLVVRPFIILSTSPVAVLMAVYLSILFAYLSLLATTIATVFQEHYGFSESQSGLIYIALTAGTLSGALMCRFTLDYFLVRGFSRQKPQEDAAIRAENRLIPIIPAMIAFPIGLLLYGWSLQYRLHWIVAALSTILCGFSLSSSTTPIMNYLVDIFGPRSASAVAAVLPLRYIAGAFMPVAAPYMYATLGYGWGNSLLAFVLLIAIPVPLLVIVKPQKMTMLTKLER